ncbi:hypothetical protein TNCV_948861 [Trichonephila clavipes]|nr:hypothetical protein TNCV_948861 [Trichonephila clavipes]
METGESSGYGAKIKNSIVSVESHVLVLVPINTSQIESLINNSSYNGDTDWYLYHCRPSTFSKSWNYFLVPHHTGRTFFFLHNDGSVSLYVFIDLMKMITVIQLCYT